MNNSAVSTSAATMDHKTALITGAARRLGKEIAVTLAQAGWDIVLHYNRSAAEAEQTAAQIRALGRQCYPLGYDLSPAQAATERFQAAKAQEIGRAHV